MNFVKLFHPILNLNPIMCETLKDLTSFNLSSKFLYSIICHLNNIITIAIDFRFFYENYFFVHFIIKSINYFFNFIIIDEEFYPF